MVLKFLPFLLLLAGQAQSQKTGSAIKFSSISHLGLLTGNGGEAMMAQTINGVNKGKWFAGIGAGLDFYKDRTIPLFVDVRRELLTQANTPFVYGDLGLNFSWLNFIQKEQKGFPTSSPGAYYDVGLGWKLKGKNNRGFLLSGGYSFKQVKEKVRRTWGAPTIHMQEENFERFNYLYRRVVIKMGLQL